MLEITKLPQGKRTPRCSELFKGNHCASAKTAKGLLISVMALTAATDPDFPILRQFFLDF